MKNRGQLISIAVILISVVLTSALSSCGKIDFHTLEVGAGDPDSLKTNLVRIENRTNDGMLIEGTGFFTPSGALVTTSNVVDHGGEITIEYADGLIADAKLVSNDIDNNIAVLSTDNIHVGAVSLDKSTNVSGSQMQVIGFSEKSNLPVTVSVNVNNVAANDQGILVLTPGLPQSYSGAVVIDENGTVQGQVTLASDRLDYALALNTDQLQANIDNLINNQKKSKLDEDALRSNNYTNYIQNTLNQDTDELYLPDDYLSGQTVTETGVQFSIDQKNGRLINLYYDASNSSENDTLLMDGDSQPVAVAETSEGRYTFPLTRIQISKDMTGVIPLYFDNLDGVIQSITLQGVSSLTNETVRISLNNKHGFYTSEKEKLENDESFVEFIKALEVISSYDENKPADLMASILIDPSRYGLTNFFPDIDVKKIPENKFRWYVQTIFNVSDENYESFKRDLPSNYQNDFYLQLSAECKDGYYYIYSSFERNHYQAVYCGIDSVQKNENLYEIQLYGESIRTMTGSIDNSDGFYYWGKPKEDFVDTRVANSDVGGYITYYNFELEKKEINGRDYWTVHKEDVFW